MSLREWGTVRMMPWLQPTSFGARSYHVSAAGTMPSNGFQRTGFTHQCFTSFPRRSYRSRPHNMEGRKQQDKGLDGCRSIAPTQARWICWGEAVLSGHLQVHSTAWETSEFCIKPGTRGTREPEKACRRYIPQRQGCGCWSKGWEVR